MYSNIVKVPTSSRGLVSPIADNAALYYRFYLEDTYSDNGIKVHKIYTANLAALPNLLLRAISIYKIAVGVFMLTT